MKDRSLLQRHAIVQRLIFKELDFLFRESKERSAWQRRLIVRRLVSEEMQAQLREILRNPDERRMLQNDVFESTSGGVAFLLHQFAHDRCEADIDIVGLSVDWKGNGK